RFRPQIFTVDRFIRRARRGHSSACCSTLPDPPRPALGRDSLLDCLDHCRRDRAQRRSLEQRSCSLGGLTELFAISLAATVPRIRWASEQFLCSNASHVRYGVHLVSARGTTDVAPAIAKANRSNRESRCSRCSVNSPARNSGNDISRFILI